ncbi:TonB-dependent receptor [Sphingomonas sp.]|jgi:iron complex outermembrane receptor protein|uniref:TonB-dependent receptor n=1 Tax=Sphingomonas sp. TaxID=28214 RepID=UPI002EDAEAB3
MKRLSLAAAASLAALAAASSASAQDATTGTTAQPAPTADPASAAQDDIGSGDIVVTALKRAENVQRVPVAINVVGPAALANAGATKLEDLTKLAPSVSFTPASGQIHSTISMRGVYSNNLAPGIPAAVGVVVDDIAQPPEAQGFNELADIERIEVLRGPQSTISGRNASAGLINIVTRAPSDVFTAKADLTATSDQELRSQLYVSGPLGETLSASASGYANTFRGVVRNIVTDDYYGRRSYGGRVKLRWQPSAAFEATLTGFLQHLNDQSAAPITQSFSPNANRLGLPFQQAAGAGIVFDGTNRFIASPVRGYQRSDSRAASLRMALDVGENQLLSITGYQHEDIDQVQDVLGVTQAAISRSAGFDGTQRATLPTETFSQEFRFVSLADQPFSYILGAYYLDTTADYSFVRAGVAPFSRQRDTGLRNYAAYVRATFRAGDALTATGGLRYNREEIRYSLLDRLTPTNNSVGNDSDDVVLGDASLQYEVQPDVSVYGRYARGYQGKAFDTDAPTVRPNPALPYNAATNPTLPFAALKPETVDSFELGLKSQFLDRRITFNVALYRAHYQDYQAQTRVDDGNGFFIFRLASAGKVTTQGVEAELVARIGDALRLDMAGAYTDAEFKNFTTAPCYGGQTAAQGCVGGIQNLSGQGLGYTPKWRGNLGAEYRLPIDAVRVSLRSDVTWQSAVNFDVLGDPLPVQKSYALVNLSAAFASPDERYKLTVFVNNVFNQQYFTQLTDNTTSFSFGAPAGTVNRVLATRYLPRDYRAYGGVRLSTSF